MNEARRGEESLEAYAGRLEGYTLSELEDVFAHLDRKEHPERLERVRNEIERRMARMEGGLREDSTSSETASFLRRWWGSLLDLFVQVFILAVVFLLYMLVNTILTGFEEEESAAAVAPELSEPSLFAFVGNVLSGDPGALANTEMWGRVALVVAGFFVYRALLTLPAWIRTGQTPGMREVGVRVVSASGGPLTRRQAWGRFAAQHVLFGLTIGVSGLWILWDRHGRALHDRLAGTHVLRADRVWEKPPEMRIFDD